MTPCREKIPMYSSPSKKLLHDTKRWYNKKGKTLPLKEIFFQRTSSLTSRVTSQLIPGLDGDIVTQCYKVCIRVTL